MTDCHTKTQSPDKWDFDERRNNYTWTEFINQPHNKDWIKLDNLTVHDLKEAVKMCKGCAVPMTGMMAIVQDISIKFNLSPKDSFNIFKHHGKGNI